MQIKGAHRDWAAAAVLYKVSRASRVLGLNLHTNTKRKMSAITVGRDFSSLRLQPPIRLASSSRSSCRASPGPRCTVWSWAGKLTVGLSQATVFQCKVLTSHSLVVSALGLITARHPGCSCNACLTASSDTEVLSAGTRHAEVMAARNGHHEQRIDWNRQEHCLEGTLSASKVPSTWCRE